MGCEAFVKPVPPRSQFSFLIESLLLEGYRTLRTILYLAIGDVGGAEYIALQVHWGRLHPESLKM